MLTREAKNGTQEEAHAANEVPHSYVPAKDARCGLPPMLLCLDGEEEAGNDEEHTSDHLRHPVDTVDHTCGAEMVVYAG